MLNSLFMPLLSEMAVYLLQEPALLRLDLAPPGSNKTMIRCFKRTLARTHMSLMYSSKMLGVARALDCGF
jgi:hypothetical protein